MKLFGTLFLILTFVGLSSAQIPDFTPPNPLIRALLHNETVEAKRLLSEGADVNGPRFLGFPPVFFPVMHQNLDLTRAMIEKGASLKEVDPTGSTVLMWASFNENADTALVEELLKAGLDPKATNKAGETALTWALRRGHTPVVTMLKKAGASQDVAIKGSIERGIALLQKSGPQFIKASGCVSCHHQFLPQMSVALARDRGLTVNEEPSRQAAEATINMFKPLQDVIAKSKDRIPDPPISVGYALLALAAENYPADETTASMIGLIERVQLEDGSFRSFPSRPPMESSHFTATALGLRALQLYGKDSDARVTRARAWLRSESPRTMEDRAMQLLGLTWSKARPEDIRKRGSELLAEQQPNGGWAQLPGIETDAYATGQALVALNRSGRLPATDPAYQRGIAFLLRTQLADGSWLVRTRTFPVQRYNESGFPHGKDQWISASGTSWATMALSLALPSQRERSRVFSSMNKD